MLLLIPSHSYQLASRLQERLDEMGKDLTSMIEEINDASSTLSKNNNVDDPVRYLCFPILHLQLLISPVSALPSRPRPQQPPHATPTNRPGSRCLTTESERSPESKSEHRAFERSQWSQQRCCGWVLSVVHGTEMILLLALGILEKFGRSLLYIRGWSYAYVRGNAFAHIWV